MGILDICNMDILKFNDRIIDEKLGELFEEEEYEWIDSVLKIHSHILVATRHFSDSNFRGKDEPKFVLSGHYFSEIKYIKGVDIMNGSYDMNDLIDSPVIIDKVGELTFEGSHVKMSNLLKINEVDKVIYYPHNIERDNVIPYITSQISNINSLIISISDYINSRIDLHKIVGIRAHEMIIVRDIIDNTPGFDKILDFIIKNNDIKYIYEGDRRFYPKKSRLLFSSDI